MTAPYRPIDCALHDELQLRALRRRSVEVAWVDDDGATRSRPAIPVDVFTRAGAEYLRLDDGTELRLDRLVTVDGIPFRPGAC